MLTEPKIIGVIPARLDSRRLPEKVLRKIGDRAMLHRVYDRARQSTLLAELYVATDSETILDYCRQNSIHSIRTGRHASGSDRLYEVMQRTDGDIYVNIQGDEPTIRPEHIERLLRPILSGRGEATTLKVLTDADTAKDPNIVKVVTDKTGHALYFSRLPIPCSRDAQEAAGCYKHIGLYGYTRSLLETFHSLEPSPLEKTEKLEQLRLLENGIDLLVEETPYDTIGVDTEEDLKKAAAFLAAEKVDE